MPPITRTPRYGTVDSGPHAVTVADGFDYTYDDVGNLTQTDDGDTVTKYTYDVLNRLVGIDFDYQSGDDLTMVYDADGNRVTRTEGAITVTYIGGLYEITNDGSTVTTRTHYMFAGDMVGTRVDDGTTDTITYTFGDHLGSVTAAYTPPQNGNGDDLQTQYYKPYGEPRGTTASLPSDRTYTGQIDDPGVLMYYNARYYQPSIGRFTQPDTIIPDPGNSQDYNRYMYVRGNPTNGSDPTGHKPNLIDLGPQSDSCGDRCAPPRAGDTGRSFSDIVGGVFDTLDAGADIYEAYASLHFEDFTSGGWKGQTRYYPALKEGTRRTLRNTLLGTSGVAAKQRGLLARGLGRGFFALATIADGVGNWHRYQEIDNTALRVVASTGRTGTSAGGALAGLKGGSVGGAAVGAAFCGPGCAVVGGVIGGIAGAIGGSWVGARLWGFTFGRLF